MELQQSKPGDQELSQTAQDYINAQLDLENEAREVLPYAFDKCTKEMGPIRQLVFACLTCTPAGTSPAGMCYSCSISCHGSHGDLVELFSKRNFVCDCGTNRFPDTFCSLRKCKNDEAANTNAYNQNFKGRFCQDELYDAEEETGTMYQCLLGDVCGEDWFHDTCIVGTTLEKHGINTVQQDESMKQTTVPPLPSESVTENPASDTNRSTKLIVEADTQNIEDNIITSTTVVIPAPDSNDQEDEGGLEQRPEGFPSEDDFDSFICWRCVSANPWLIRYAGTDGFLDAVPRKSKSSELSDVAKEAETREDESLLLHPVQNGHGEKIEPSEKPLQANTTGSGDADNTSTELPAQSDVSETTNPKEISTARTKRKFEDEAQSDDNAERLKRLNVTPMITSENATENKCKAPPILSTETSEPVSIFLKADFRSYMCHCPSCFPLLAKFPVLLEEEDTYEPPLDDDVNSAHESLFDAGEKALNSMDRVKAIEGVMAYNMLREKVRAFLQPFAEQKKVVGEDDVKKYFEELANQEH